MEPSREDRLAVATRLQVALDVIKEAERLSRALRVELVGYEAEHTAEKARLSIAGIVSKLLAD